MLEGDTGGGELGINFKSLADSAFSMDLSMQSYTGMREGVTGSVLLKYKFCWRYQQIATENTEGRSQKAGIRHPACRAFMMNALCLSAHVTR